MAEALLAEALGGHDDARVESAGIGALVDYPADPHAVALMAAKGLDIASHRARQFDGSMGCDFDLLLVMEVEQQRIVESRWPLLTGRVHTLGRWGGFEIDDPYRQPREAFEASLADIERGVSDWLGVLQDG